MIHIAICEDDITYLCELEKIIKENKNLSVEVHSCSSPEERFKLYETGSTPYDIVLMDIELQKNLVSSYQKKSSRLILQHRSYLSRNIVNIAVMFMKPSMYTLFTNPMRNNTCLVRSKKQSLI